MLPEILLKNGAVVDGTGRPAEHADVLISGGRIATVGVVPESASAEVVDCTGLTVAPGFIDVHSHSDKEVLEHRSNKVLQGVTTEVLGNCGFSLFPTHPNPEGIRLTGETFDGEPPEGMATSAEYFRAVEQAGTLVNVAALTGHTTLRVFAMQVRRDPAEDDLRRMEAALDACLDAGSIGLSTGLNCMPGTFARTDEVTRLCRRLKPGRLYTTHLRDYKFHVLEAVDEAIAIARAADVPVQISHMQVVGKKNWAKLDEAIARIEQARSDGLDIAMDAYPYLAGSCSLIQFLPEWAQDGGTQGLLARLADPLRAHEVARATDDYMSNTWDDLMISGVSTPAGRSLIGKSIAKVAAERDQSAPETAMQLLLEEAGFLYVISFNNNEENLRKVLTHPLTSVITDGMVMDGVTHPRTYGTYPKFLGEYVREKRWMSLEDAIVKTSSLAARRFGLEARGTIARGYFADLVAFDADRIGTRSDYAEPARQPEGIRHVLVNGRFAVRDGELTGTKAGVALRF